MRVSRASLQQPTSTTAAISEQLPDTLREFLGEAEEANASITEDGPANLGEWADGIVEQAMLNEEKDDATAEVEEASGKPTEAKSDNDNTNDNDDTDADTADADDDSTPPFAADPEPAPSKIVSLSIDIPPTAKTQVTS